MNEPDAIQKLVQAARERAANEHAEKARESGDDVASLNSNRQAAGALQSRLAGELASICMQASGAMHWASEPLSAGGSEYRLTWVDPEPERTVSIVVEDAGIVLWGWFSDWLRPVYKHMPATGFTDAFLMNLVGALADQAAWEDKRAPEV